MKTGTVWEETQLCYSPSLFKFSLKLFKKFFLRKTWQQNNIFELYWHDWNVWVWAFCSMCYRLNTVQQVPCLSAQAGHRERTSCAHGSPDFRCLETVQSCQRRRLANQNSTWLKDTHTHWPLLQPGECCSSLKWLSRVAPTVWVLCKYWQGYCASEQSTF